MGVEQELLPDTEEEGQRIAYLIGNSQPAADEDSLKLGKALMDVPLESAENFFEKGLAYLEMHYRSGLSRAILGSKAGDDLGLPDTLFKISPLFTAPLVFTIESIRMVIPGLTDVMANFGEQWQRYRIDSMIKGQPAQFMLKQ